MQTEAKTELKYENGLYTVKNGDKVTPEELAKTLSEAISLYNNLITRLRKTGLTILQLLEL